MEMKMKQSLLNNNLRDLMPVKRSLRSRLLVWVLKRMAYNVKKMAQYAYQNTRFYRKFYEKTVQGHGSIQAVPFNRLPPVSKTELNMSSSFDLLSQKLEKKVYKYAETTGSTGNPTPSFFTRKEFYGSVVMSKITPYFTYLKDILKVNRKAICGLARGFTIAGDSFQQVLDQAGFLTINVDARTTISPPHRIAKLLTKFRPSVIVASETDFMAWMKVLKEDYPGDYDVVVSGIKGLISTAELCSNEHSAAISNYFDLVHLDAYACVEGFFSIPCPCGEKHILPIYHTEVLSADLTESQEYGKGRFAFTNMARRSTPLIRYLLDDLVTIYPSDCRYGFKKSITPHGRYEMSVAINNEVYGVRHFEAIFFRNYLFGEYQVQINDDHILVKAEDYALGEIPLDDISWEMTARFGLETRIEIVPYGTIRDYRKIRDTKPLFRLIDKRSGSTQKIPSYT